MKIQELHSYIQEHQPNICQISVLQDGNELYSAEWNGYQKQTASISHPPRKA